MTTTNGELIYSGNFRNGHYDGYGTITALDDDTCPARLYSLNLDWKSWHDSLEYQGNWKGGDEDGKGRLVFRDGSIYEGQFEGSSLHGRGRMTSSQGWSYEGQWTSDEILGHGILRESDGRVLTGEFKCDSVTRYQRPLETGWMQVTSPDGRTEMRHFIDGKEV